MRTLSLKAGRKVWLMVLDGCEIGTQIPVSQSVDVVVQTARKLFPGVRIDAPNQTRPLFVVCSNRSNETHSP
jgi:hypothetical protein